MTERLSPRRAVRRRLPGLLGWVMLAVVAYFAWPSQWGGGTTYVVVKGTSMRPNFHTGDIVLARETNDHEVGDILVYAVPDEYAGAGKLIMHRLKSITEDGRYVFQGDNRDEPDQFDVGPEDVVGVDRIRIPKVGLATQIVGRWWFIATLIGLFAFLKLWPDEQEEQSESERDADQEHKEGEERRRRSRRATDDETVHEDGRAQSALRPAAPLERQQMPHPNQTPQREHVPQSVPVLDEPVRSEVARSGPVVVPPLPPPPPASMRRTRAYVIVDGDGLTRCGWPTVDCDVTRQMAVDLADEIAGRFGTVVVLMFEAAQRPVSDRRHAQVVFTPADATISDAVQAHLDQRRTGLTMLVVTDSLPVAELVWSLGGSVMRCAAWLALAEHVGAPINGSHGESAVPAPSGN